MKMFGITLTFNGFDVWHKGNLTKLSQLTNDIGTGTKITTSTTAPTNPSDGDIWNKVVG